MKFGRKIFALVLASALTITGGVVFADGDGDTTATVDKTKATFVNFNDVTTAEELKSVYGFEFSGSAGSNISVVDAPVDTSGAGSNYGKVLKLAYDKAIWRDFSDSFIEEGIVNVSYKFRVDACAAYLMVSANTGADDHFAGDLLLMQNDGATIYGGSAEVSTTSEQLGKWYIMEQSIDFDLKKVTSTLKNADGTVVSTVVANNFQSLYRAEPTGGAKMKGLYLYAAGGTTEVYLDDLSVERVTAKGAITFNDITTTAELKSKGVNFKENAALEIVDAPVDASGAGSTYGKALKVGTDTSVWAYFLNKPMSDGIYRISYKAYIQSAASAFVADVLGDSVADPYSLNPLLANWSGGKYMYLSDNGYLGAETPLQTWYTIEQNVDLKRNLMVTNVYKADGTKIGNTTTTAFKALYGDAVNTNKLRGVHFCGLGATDAYLDDINIEELNRCFVTDGLKVSQLRPNTNVQAVVSADEGKTCLISFYDADGNLLSVKMETIGAGNGNTWHSGLVTVPTGAASAKAYVWDLGKLSPLYDPLSL